MVSFLTKEELQKLTTKRLLAYKNKLMKCPETPNWDEYNRPVMNKQDPKWQDLYAMVKEVLSSREHVDD